MLQFRNETPFVGSLTVMPDADGIDTLIAVVKGTFTLGAEPQLAPEQVPVTPAAEYWGDAPYPTATVRRHRPSR